MFQRAPKSRFSSFAEERLPGIGHNQGPPLDVNTGFRRIAWKKARAQLMPRLPLEVIKRRVRRATELGLEYPAYASILLGTGRDIVGFLFTCDALGMRLSKTVPLPDNVQRKLSNLEKVDSMLAIEHDQPEAMHNLLSSEMQDRFATMTRLPTPDALPNDARTAIRGALDPLKLPGDAVVMIGTQAHQRDWADAARLGRFIPAERYFGQQAG